jgi:5-oxoprolinase (ATP-hydrolysing)
MSRVFIHPLAGVLSAYGMGLADQIVIRHAAVEHELNEAGVHAARTLSLRLQADAGAELEAQGVVRDARALRTVTRAHVRYQGTDTGLGVDLPMRNSPADAIASIRKAFEHGYRRRFAFLMPNQALVIESVSVECIAPGAEAPGADPVALAPAAHKSPGARADAAADAVLRMYCLGGDEPPGWREARLFRVETLPAGANIDGPAILAERNATTVVEPGWRASVTASGCVDLERIRPRAARHAAGTRVDPVVLELFNNVFMNIAEQMGLRLQNTAYSVNIKERLDFSCALFDAEGSLIANAPHMPVHLGSMSESIRTVIARNSEMRSGDVYVLNDPYHGGTHLPDVTVVTPVHLEGGDAHPSFFVASRGHHADIGGITPGSMPPFSHTVEEEGVLLDNVKLVEQ